ncbi:MAG: hypothetical protein U0003_03970 [Vampirovibrionales bacterium]
MKGESAIQSFIKSVERMEDLLLAGFSIPFTPWLVVNGDQLLPLLDHVRDVLPEEIIQARLILDRRDDIIAEAQRKGAFTLEEARRQAESMLNNSALMRAVEDEAAKIRHQLMAELEAQRKAALSEMEQLRLQAAEDARRVREGADAYAEQVLNSLDKDLASFHQVVKNGQQHLRHIRHEASTRQPKAMMSITPPAPTSPAPVGDLTSSATDGLQLPGQASTLSHRPPMASKALADSAPLPPLPTPRTSPRKEPATSQNAPGKRIRQTLQERQQALADSIF